jgi:hypothetical protein
LHQPTRIRQHRIYFAARPLFRSLSHFG